MLEQIKNVPYIGRTASKTTGSEDRAEQTWFIWDVDQQAKKSKPAW